MWMKKQQNQRERKGEKVESDLIYNITSLIIRLIV